MIFRGDKIKTIAPAFFTFGKPHETSEFQIEISNLANNKF